MNHAIIFTGAGYEVTLTRMSGAKKIANACEAKGWKVDVVDFFMRWTPEQLDEYLALHVTSDTKWIGLSYTFLAKHHDYVKQFLIQTQTQYPDLLYIIGGSNSFLESLPADYYISGFAENAIIKILDHEFNNGPMPMFEKRHGGRYVSATRDYPAASAPSYRVTYNDSDFLTPQDVLTIELSRGCKFRCSFCAYPFLGIKEDTSATEESIYAELMDNYQRWGVKHYVTADDTLNDRTEKLVKLRNVVNRLDFKPTFSSYVRADLFKSHPEHLELLAECNVVGQFYGVETFNHQTGKIIGKGMHPDDMKQTLLEAKSYFTTHMELYRGFLSFVIGLPYETKDMIWDTVKWLNANWADQAANFHTLVITLEGEYVSAMGQNLTKYGYTHDNNPKRLHGQSYDVNKINWTSPWMSSDEALTLRPQILNSLRLRSASNFAVQNYIAALGIETFKNEEANIKAMNMKYSAVHDRHIHNYIKNKLNNV